MKIASAARIAENNYGDKFNEQYIIFAQMCTSVERRVEIHCLMWDFLEFIVITQRGHGNFNLL